DRLLRLLLRADEQDGSAVGDGLLDELVGTVDVRQRLLEVDDVDAVALGEDETLHLRVPTAGLVPEVDTALEELTHGHDGHDSSFRRIAGATRSMRTIRRRSQGFRRGFGFTTSSSDDAPGATSLGAARGREPGADRCRDEHT